MKTSVYSEWDATYYCAWIAGASHMNAHRSVDPLAGDGHKWSPSNIYLDLSSPIIPEIEKIHK